MNCVVLKLVQKLLNGVVSVLEIRWLRADEGNILEIEKEELHE
jgi:hypothetical protein